MRAGRIPTKRETPEFGKTLTRSRLIVGVGYQGAIPSEAWGMLESIWLSALPLEANDARANRSEVALLASLGFISTIAPDGLSYTRAWRITAEGFHALRERDDGRTTGGGSSSKGR